MWFKVGSGQSILLSTDVPINRPVIQAVDYPSPCVFIIRTKFLTTKSQFAVIVQRACMYEHVCVCMCVCVCVCVSVCIHDKCACK